MVASFRLAIFLGAGLLFVVQPMFAKMVLPMLGGSPAVWNTCMFFFQGVLLTGYGYAHLSQKFLTPRKQVVIHLVLLLVVLFLPIRAISTAWVPPGDETPIFWLLGLLTVVVGSSFFAVSATGPLIQSWFSVTKHQRASNPYFLYAFSNAGSLLALLAYPFVIERTLELESQTALWNYVYLFFVAVMAVCGYFVWKSPATEGSFNENSIEGDGSNTANQETNSLVESNQETARISWSQRSFWIGLAFVPSSWMLGVTSFLTTDITPMPVLWIIPLSIYLVTFIIAFSEKSSVIGDWVNRLFPIAMMVLAATTLFKSGLLILFLHLVFFLVGALMCHLELARRKPGTEHLTEFYLWISVGGLLGGLFNGLIAPLCFPWILEYPLTLMLACALCPTFSPGLAASSESTNPDASQLKKAAKGKATKSKKKMQKPDPGVQTDPEQVTRNIKFGSVIGFALCVAVLANVLGYQGTVTLILVTMVSLGLLAVLFFIDRPIWFAVPLGAVLILAKLEPPQPGEKVLYTGRSFFGVNRVVSGPGNVQRRLYHGTTVHGIQSTDPKRPELDLAPLTYYHRTGPLGMIFDRAQRDNQFQQVGVIGLGAGTAASYCKAGQKFVFFEIDPIVRAIAEDPEYFTFLQACGTDNYRIIMGDGRLKLSEIEDQRFDLLVFDAFSSDAIPMHLLTREAIEMYQTKLSERGFLAFHISNLHFDLEPILGDLAADLDLQTITCHDRNISDEELAEGKAPASYVVLTKSLKLTGLERLPQWKKTRTSGRERVWTDSFSNLFDALK